MTVRLSYVVPVHNQEAVLAQTVARLVDRLHAHPGSEILLIENGSTDASPALCRQLALPAADGSVRVRADVSERGFGHAHRRGIELASGDVIVLTAADLPFGFTDLDRYLATTPRPAVAIGSKGHPRSRVSTSWRRRLMSAGFRLMRRAVLGLGERDTQGTILIDRQLAQALLPHLRCGDFLVSTELVSWARRAGHRAVELPVDYAASGESTVSPLRDSMRMARGLFAVRSRLAAADRAASGAAAS